MSDADIALVEPVDVQEPIESPEVEQRGRRQSQRRTNNFNVSAEIRELKAKFQQQQALLQAITSSLGAASHALLSHTSVGASDSLGSHVFLAEEGGVRQSPRSRQFNQGGNFNSHYTAHHHINNHNNHNNNSRGFGRKFSHRDRQTGPPPFE
jgi:hypothetical protein